MDLIYADQAQKIDIRLLMAKVLKTGRARDYLVTYDLNMWPPISGLKVGERGDQLSALITLDRPADGPVTEPLLGQMLMRFFLADGRRTEQMLLLTGLPATARSLALADDLPLQPQTGPGGVLQSRRGTVRVAQGGRRESPSRPRVESAAPPPGSNVRHHEGARGRGYAARDSQALVDDRGPLRRAQARAGQGVRPLRQSHLWP